MESAQHQYGGGADLIEVDGIRSITLNPTLLEMGHPSKLSYYRGFVKSGNQLDRIDELHATIFKDKEYAEELYALINQVDHPSLIKALGFANNVEDNISHSYLALESFKITFAFYTKKHGLGVDQKGRFTEEFIALFSNIVNGLEELHSMNYYCPVLKPDSIAVLRKADSVSAKIWEFERCDEGMEEQQKDHDWFRLGTMIFEVALNLESLDLVKKIKLRQLKGQSILKHSALLTVRKKFQNVLALNFHVSVHYPQKPNTSESKDQLNVSDQSKDQLKVSDLCVANLKSDLDKKLVWNTPGWINASETKTLRGFIKQLRILFEHEFKYIPPQLEGIPCDLEHHLQASCGDIMLAVQKLVDELKLNH